ncbi:hypothetical protein GCM10028857_08320 [Salinarchaeum chitinilyticum]
MAETLLHVSDSMAFASRSSNDGAVDLGGLPVVARRAIDRDVDAVVHTGNLFRSPAPADETVEAVHRTFAQLDDAGIPVFVLRGAREATSDGDAIERLREDPGVHAPGAKPTAIGDVTLYGIDHVESEQELRRALDALEPAEGYTHNVVAVNQRIWPPLANDDADISAFDAMEATDVFVDEIFAGGTDEPASWAHDDFDYRVSYAGSTNPEHRGDDAVPTATLITAGTDEHDHERVPLTRTAVSDEIEALRAALDHEPSDLGNADLATLADLYGLTARAKELFDDRRQEIREALLDRVHEDTRIQGEYATVNRTTSQRRVTKSEREVFDALRQVGVHPLDVLELDSSALRALSEAGTIEDEAIFDREERTYVRVSETDVEGR